jgi:hypothetical protein
LKSRLPITPTKSEDWPARMGADFQLKASIREALDKERQSHCLPCLCFMTIECQSILKPESCKQQVMEALVR